METLGLDQSTSIIFSVLKLFIIPVGGGIPAGVMLAQRAHHPNGQKVSGTKQ
jgi:hypothetical protein